MAGYNDIVLHDCLYIHVHHMCDVATCDCHQVVSHGELVFQHVSVEKRKLLALASAVMDERTKQVT